MGEQAGGLIGGSADQVWDDFLSGLSGLDTDRLAVGFDLEADGLHRYQERICLVQMCWGDEVHLIDPLGEADLSPLVDWVGRSQIWMHGADYDMSLMIAGWDRLPASLLDTQVAAQLLGYEKFGYASLVEELFGVELSKSSQKADWGRRPLPEKMLEYARNDVTYLMPMAEKLTGFLKEKGRWEWFLESCEASMKRVVDRQSEEKQPWRIAGAGKLRAKGLNFLKALWHWRDDEARDWNRPSFMVAGNKQLISWATTLADGGRVGFPPSMRRSRRENLQEAIQNAKKIPESEWPQHPKRERRKKDPTFESRLKKVMDHRNAIARELGIDPSVIASRAVLEGIVGGRSEAGEVLLKWQYGLLYDE